MPSEVILPRVDMDMATGKISKWFVAPGAAVTKGQPLFEIETDKAAMEIEAPATGTIRDLADASGADIPVGAIVAWIFAEGEAPAAATAPASTASPAAPVAETPARIEAENERFDSALPPAMAEAPDAERRGPVEAGDPNRPRATPMARRLARSHGLDLAALTGTGPKGRIQAADIAEAATRRPQSVSATPAGSMGAAAAAASVLEPEPAHSLLAVDRPRSTASAASTLNIVQLREGQGTPTVLIHGFGADANTWRPFLSGRSSKRPVFALDLPGHGASTLGAVSDFATLVDAVEAALVGADLGAVDMVGHSLGGAIAAALAGRGSLDLRSLLLLSPAGLGPEVNGAFVEGFLRATSEAALTPWMRELVTDPAAITPAFVRSTLKARDRTGLAETQRQIAEAVFPNGTQASSIRADLAGLTVPTRVVFGSADKIIPARQTAALPPLVALHLLPNIGHMPQFEARDLVAAIHDQMAD